MLSKWLLLICCFVAINLNAQVPDFKKINGLPTEEVFDLYSGFRGNIWVAHSLGLSRYDGHIFTHFQTPDGSPEGVTDICQDMQGRIWCHDFNGKIYYVEHEKMFLFDKYKAGERESFPVITIVDSELIVTTSRGFFICNTATFKSRYLNIINKPIYRKSIAIKGKSIISYDLFGAYMYEPSRGIRPIVTVDTNGQKYKEILRGFNLAPIRTKDTMYGFNNYDVFTLIERNDSLKILKIEPSLGMVNTITATNGKIWINTKKCSYTTDRKDTIWNRNLSDILIDNSGNEWVASLQDGLSMKAAYKGWESKNVPFLDKSDFIRCMVSVDSNIIYGTQSGKILFFKNNKLINKIEFPSSAGSIENIFVMPNKSLIVAPSVGLYYTKLFSKKIFMLMNMATFKDVGIKDNDLLLAMSGGLMRIELTDKIKTLLLGIVVSDNVVQVGTTELTSVFKNQFKTVSPILLKRCYKINYDGTSNLTFAIFKDGLAEIINNKARYIYDSKGKVIEASCITQHNKVTYIGTLNQGIIVYNKKIVDSITVSNGLFSGSILNMKQFDNKIFIIELGYFQVYDIESKKVTSTIPLPSENVGNVYDFTVQNGSVYLTYPTSIYYLNLKKIPKFTPVAFVVSAKAVISDREISNNATLSYNDNNIKIILSSPSYNYPEATYFMYRMKGSYDTTWKKLDGPLYQLVLPSLKPGGYSLEAYAVNFQNVRSHNTILLSFTIGKPWWQSWWFYLLLSLSILSISAFFIKYVFRRIKLRNQVALDKLNLQNSLRKSLLRTITAQMNPHFIFNAMNTIQSFVYRNEKRSASNYLGKFSELIRKILETSNIDSITLQEEIEILILYLDLEKARFEDNFNVELEIDPVLQADEIYVPPMFIQPYIENAIKHGLLHKKTGRNLFIAISLDIDKSNYIRIIIDDNGIGRKRSMELNHNLRGKYKSFATKANENRIDLINHTLENKIILSIKDKANDEGTVVTVQLPIINKNYD